jgi:hypothetical protein
MVCCSKTTKKSWTMNLVYYYPFRLDKEIPTGVPRLPGSFFQKVQTKVLAEQVRRGLDELAFRSAAEESDAV